MRASCYLLLSDALAQACGLRALHAAITAASYHTFTVILKLGLGLLEVGVFLESFFDLVGLWRPVRS